MQLLHLAQALTALTACASAAHAQPILSLLTRRDDSLYGAGATPYGPTSEGNTSFAAPAHAASVDATSDTALFQDLLAAEWIVADLYAQGVALFGADDFVRAGFANDTYDRIGEIAQNENGHLRIFEAAVAAQGAGNAAQPSKCKYDFGLEAVAGNKTLQAQAFLDVVSQVEAGSMAYLTGLAQSARQKSSLAVIMGIISAETRHLTWANGDALGVGPFAAPADTVYPYARQILSVTKQFVVPGSCPASNPQYPTADQRLPKLSLLTAPTAPAPTYGAGGTLRFAIANATHNDTAPSAQLRSGAGLSAQVFHSVFNYTVPVRVLSSNSSSSSSNATALPSYEITLPANLTSNRGELLVALTNRTQGAKDQFDIVAGPLLVQQELPAALA